MALYNSFMPSLAFAVLAPFFFVVLFICKKSNNHKSNKNLPPGKMGLPWIGETMEFYKAQQKNLVFEKFLQPRIAKHGKIFKTKLMGSPTVVVNGGEANRFFMTNEFKLVISSWPSSSVQLMGKDSIMEKQGEAHRFLRGVIATSLSGVGLEAILPKMCRLIQIHLDKCWHGQEKIYLYRVTKILTFTIVFECLLGIGVAGGVLGKFERVLEGVFALPFEFPGSKFSRAKRARKTIEKMLIDVVRRKREEMEGGLDVGEEEGMLLSRLVAGLIRGEISEKEVVDNVVLLVFAAHDTTSFAIAMTFRMLAHHPHCYSSLLQVSYSLIYPRKLTARVLWTAYGTHYSEEYFREPTTFDPKRFQEPVQPYSFIPFGGGPRLCAGNQLAKLNILLFVHYVVTRYNWSLLHPDEPITTDPLPFPSRGMPIKISHKL
ncbi:hypothetical protein RJ639_009677 [Escallonia herrerae]|uniref:Cytochrome P450 n=1 Tax=Escallonia herrerae TaxID=1293975 RepID=A0AA88VX09_9ASTE|nr:hypothetical protein RJ639_009677 [Escallonia herrerae]